tara:strand:- start:742 stop:1077 length:336 start_codon:yes stop_codon:yes gene_type:complete
MGAAVVGSAVPTFLYVKFLPGASMSTRDFYVNFLKRCQEGVSVVNIDGKPVENPLMSKEEADLRIGLFDGDIEPTLDIEIRLAEYEAMRWPKSAHAKGRLWKLMEQKKLEE